MKAIPASNYTVQPFLTHKAQSYLYTFLSGSNPPQLTIDVAQLRPSSISYSSSISLFDSKSAAINSSSGIYQIPLYLGVQNLMYRSGSPYTPPYFYVPQEPQFYVMSIAQQAYGETIQPTSILITSPASTASLVDDGIGNIITLSPTLLWADNFNRNDTSASVIGSASVGLANTGQAYTFSPVGYTLSGSIANGQLVFPSGSPANIGVGGDIGTSDFTFVFTLASSSISASQAWAIGLRQTTMGSNTVGFFIRRLQPAEFRLDYSDLFAINPTGISVTGVSDGDQYKIVFKGATVTAYRNNIQIGGVFTVANTWNQSILLTGTKFSFSKATADQGVIFDNLAIYSSSPTSSRGSVIATSSIWVDNFNRVDGPVGFATSGQAYFSSSIGTWAVSSSLLKVSGTVPEAIGGDVGTPNILFNIRNIVNASTEMEYRFRYVDQNNFLSYYLYFGTLYLRKMVGGVVSVINTSTGTNTPGFSAQYTITAFGNLIQTYINGNLVISAYVTESILQTGTKFYLYHNNDGGGGTTYVMDNLSIDSYTTYSIAPPAVGSVNYSLGVMTLKQFTGSFSASTVTDLGCYFTTGSQVNVNFNASQTIYEHQIMCTMDAGDFNYSTNPSVSTGSSAVSGTGKIIDQFASQSLTPYMTTVGCYTNRGELVALGKFPRPVKRAPDTQQTVIIRFDI